MTGPTITAATEHPVADGLPRSRTRPGAALPLELATPHFREGHGTA
jgi:hypothetical protein